MVRKTCLIGGRNMNWHIRWIRLAPPHLLPPQPDREVLPVQFMHWVFELFPDL